MTPDASAHDTSTAREAEQHLAFMLRATELLALSLDLRDTLQNVCTAAVTTIADIAIVDLGEPGSTGLVAAAHRDPAITHEIAGAGVHLDSDDDRPEHPVCQVLQSGKTYFAPLIDDPWIEANASRAVHAEYLRRMQYSSMIVVPLRSRVFGVAGALTLATVAGGRPRYSRASIAFAEALGRLFASAIGKARLYDIAHEAATTFQRASLPKSFPRADAVEFYARYEPAAEMMEVGGDWYDAFSLPDGRIGVCVGDVSGHGIDACVLMTTMRTALRTALISEPDIGRAFDVVDYLLRTQHQGEFCTAILAIIDLDALTLRLGSAGHPGPKIWDEASRAVIDPFTDRDVPLGLRDLTSLRTVPKTIRLAKGSLIAFFTDGLIEWNRAPLDGDRALEQAIRKSSVRQARDPALAIRAAVISTEKTHDDTAILVARLAG